ncbi:hypothetical protein ACEYYA_02585 [Paracoccus sp. p3-h83]|uniref:hypothetical protein n=1 Tax=Paracoccus sp. p3-h83 TaxID=3342805 RepID=UPI0035B72438
MQFKLSKTHRYWWPVIVRVPDPEQAGQYLEQMLRLELEPLPRAEALAAQEAMAELTTGRALVEHEIEQTLRVVKNWDGVVDDQGTVPFSADAMRSALEHSWFRAAVARAIADSLNGEAARLGN